LIKSGINQFDVASIEEIKAVRKFDNTAKCSFMHTVKSRESIKEAYYNFGIKTFALDTKDELIKIIETTDNAKDLELFIRVAVSNEHAEIDLSKKFGALNSEASGLLRLAKLHSKKIGLKNIINLANLFGLGYEQEFEEFPSLAIGSYGDNLLNITNAYSAINNNGKIQSPSILEKIESFNKQLIWKNKSTSKKILDLKVNKQINKLLEKSVKEGTSKAAFIKGKKIYGKTGTSDGNKDLWFIGSLDNLTTGIWIGYDDNKESELSSGNAAYLWKKFISEIYKIPIKK